MCLLVSQPASTVFTEDFLQGVYAYNSDGIGVMFANENGLNILRCVPKTEAEFIKFFRENIEGRDCAWHARMRTHGDINLDNCHPYQVISADEGYPLYLAHNGVLSTGNSKDTKKSDTWHYIQDYLRPMLLKNPQFFLTPQFEDLVSSHIGTGNKFILMDAFGNSVTINEQVGVTHEGAWLSNTYAWDTTGTQYQRKAYGSSFRGGGYSYSSNAAFPWLKDDEVVEQEVVVEEDYTLVDEAIDFACELFEAAAEAGLDLDNVSWDQAEAYFTFAGSALAWGVVEAVQQGGYTQEELIDELTYASSLDDQEEFDAAWLGIEDSAPTEQVTA